MINCATSSGGSPNARNYVNVSEGKNNGANVLLTWASKSNILCVSLVEQKVQIAVIEEQKDNWFMKL